MAVGGFTSKDATLIVSAKPAATATSAATDAIDLGAIDQIGVRSEPFEFNVVIPAFTATDLPSDATLTVALEASDDETFATGVVTAISKTIGDGTAFDGATVKYRPTLKAPRYWRVNLTTGLTGSAAVGADAAKKAVSLEYIC